MELNVIGAKKSKISLNDDLFAVEFNEGLIHQVLTAYRAKGRQGTKAQKNRSAVRGGGAKPWRQKGSGRARAGTNSSPIWRSGGVTFAAQPRDFSKKLPKKMYRAALLSILSELARQDRLLVVDQLVFDEPKTKAMVSKLAEWKIDSALILLDKPDDNVTLSCRNVPHVYVTDATRVDPLSLVSCDQVVMTVDAIKALEERLKS